MYTSVSAEVDVGIYIYIYDVCIYIFVKQHIDSAEVDVCVYTFVCGGKCMHIHIRLSINAPHRLC